MATVQTILEFVLLCSIGYQIYLARVFKSSIDSRLDDLEAFVKWLKVDLNIERLEEKLTNMDRRHFDSEGSKGEFLKYIEARIYAVECFKELQLQKQIVTTQAVEVIGRRFDENDYDPTGL